MRDNNVPPEWALDLIDITLRFRSGTPSSKMAEPRVLGRDVEFLSLPSGMRPIGASKLGLKEASGMPIGPNYQVSVSRNFSLVVEHTSSGNHYISSTHS
jgi:hypothetical protein